MRCLKNRQDLTDKQQAALERVYQGISFGQGSSSAQGVFATYL